MRKVFVHTFGCQMNVYDSRRMVQLLATSDEHERYEETGSPEDADVIVINTCSVRAKPEDKVRSTLGRYAGLRQRRPGLLLVVTGCVAQQLQETLLRKAPAADIVVGPDHVAALPELLAESRRTAERAIRAEETPKDEYAFVEAAPAGEDGVTAMLTVMKGCDNYCSYCIVPYVRGREVSKPSEQVLREAQRLVEGGARELMLLGQNVNRYGMDRPGEPSFADLLRSVGALPGLARLRFTTSHPADCPPELVRCFGEVPTLCEYFHLPVQAGADTILERMRRRYSRAEYLDLVGRLREACPDIHISTDVIVGFPGESEADFAETLDLLAKVRFGSLFAFKYSPRPGTAAAELADDVTADEKARRLKAIHDLQTPITASYLAAHRGKEVEVLVEGTSRRGATQLTGRTRTNRIVNFALPDGEDPAAWTGRLVTVRVRRALAHSMRGDLVG